MHIHFLGIGGTLMGNLALLARARGDRVTGSDPGVYPPMSDQLAAAGIDVYAGWDPAALEPVPDLVVYLQAPVDTLLFRIGRRGIGYEQGIQRRYLERLTDAYSRYFHQYNESPLLIVNAATIDPVNNEEHFQMLLQEIDTARSGRQFFNPLVAALA